MPGVNRTHLPRLFPANLAPWAALPLVMAALVLLASVAPALAQEEGTAQLTEEEINRRALQMSVEFMSPYCPGANLRDCTSGKAADLRAEIKAWVAEGRSRAWIEDELVSRFGESILGAPRFKGFNALIWLMPFIALLVGGGLIFSYLQRQKRTELHEATPVTEVPEDFAVDPERAAQLERELQNRQA